LANVCVTSSGSNGPAVVTPDQIILAADVTTEANGVRQLHCHFSMRGLARCRDGSSTPPSITCESCTGNLLPALKTGETSGLTAGKAA